MNFNDDEYTFDILGYIKETKTEMNEEVINCLNKLVYFYIWNNQHIDIDYYSYYVCDLIDKLLKNTIYKDYVIHFLKKYEHYSKEIENDVKEIIKYIKDKLPNHHEYSFYPVYPLKRESGLDYIQETYNPLIETFKKNYRDTTINHAIIANTINIYLDNLTIKMNYLKFQILKTELTIKFSVKSNLTDKLNFVNEYHMLDYISIQKELNIWLKKHSILVFDSAINFVSQSPSKLYYPIYYTINNLLIEQNANIKYYDFFSLREGHPNIKNVHHLMYIYYLELIPHYEYDLPRSVVVECIKNNDEKLWNSLCTKKNLFKQTLKLPTKISSFI